MWKLPIIALKPLPMANLNIDTLFYPFKVTYWLPVKIYYDSTQLINTHLFEIPYLSEKMAPNKTQE